MNNEQYCGLRLPCGICRLTMTTCPKLNQLAYITISTGTTPSCENKYVCGEGRGDGMRYCRIKGKLCAFATEYGYCSFTVCREVTE